MRTTKPILFCALTLGILSTTQTDAFARGMPHGHGGGHFAAMEDRAKEIPHANDASKLHTVLKHPEEINSGAVSRARKEVKPEVLTSHGIVNQDDVGTAHPESKTLLKSDACFDSPKGCT